MKIRGITIHDHYTGLCNQLILFLHGVIQCICDGIDVIVIDDFKIDIHSDSCCAFGEIIDVDRFSQYIHEQYGIIVIDKSNMNIRIQQVIYGTMASFIDITDGFVRKFINNDGHLVLTKQDNLNILFGDPALNRKKSLRISYNINGICLLKSYAEEFKEMDCHLRNVSFHRYSNWPKQIGWMNTLIRMMYFHPALCPSEDVNFFKHKTIHVAHIRLEYDAIRHWANENKMETVPFYNLLADKYIEAITQHVVDGQLLVLSHNSDNRIVEWLTETGRDFIFIEKDKSRGREYNAAQDMSRAMTHGNGTFIGNFDMFRMQGSTFSYFLMMKCRFQKRVLIDIERIHEDIVVHS